MKTYQTNIEQITLKKIKSDYKKVKISSSKDAADYIKQFYFDDLEIFESVFILLLNRSNNTIGYAKISQGGIAGSVVDVKIICKYAIETLCSGVILAHNHPRGNINPSTCDDSITERVKNALNIFEIKLLDHVILTSESYYSYADNGNI